MGPRQKCGAGGRKAETQPQHVVIPVWSCMKHSRAMDHGRAADIHLC